MNNPIDRALSHAFNAGSNTADGYRDALCGMGSRHNLGQGDDNASRVRERWNTELHAKLSETLIDELKLAGWTPPGEAAAQAQPTPAQHEATGKPPLSMDITFHAVKGLDCGPMVKGLDGGATLAVRVIEVTSEAGVWKEAYGHPDEVMAFMRGVEAGAAMCGRGVRANGERREGAPLRFDVPKRGGLACLSCGT